MSSINDATSRQCTNVDIASLEDNAKAVQKDNFFHAICLPLSSLSQELEDLVICESKWLPSSRMRLLCTLF